MESLTASRSECSNSIILLQSERKSECGGDIRKKDNFFFAILFTSFGDGVGRRGGEEPEERRGGQARA